MPIPTADPNSTANPNGPAKSDGAPQSGGTPNSGSTPSWVELRTTDPATATAFYTELFDWRFEQGTAASNTAPVGAGQQALLGEIPVATISAADDRTGWITYFTVDDLNRTVEAVVGAGGEVVAAPRDRGEYGTAALVTDPTGALFGLANAPGTSDATLAGRAGTAAWFELLTDDPDCASRFYTRVLGLVAHPATLDGRSWTTLHAGSGAVAGIVTKRTSTPNRWNVYFAADDVVTTIAMAAELGATITAGPLTTAIGPMAGVRDPAGADFSLWGTLRYRG